MIGFLRFQHKNGIGKKKHSKVQLPLELKAVENMVCHYKLRACALLHGMNIHNGHHTAVIFDNGSVIEIDDRVVREATDDWIYKVQSTVYLVFYTKEYNSCNFSTEIDNSLYPGKDGDKTKEGDAREGVFTENGVGKKPKTNESENIKSFYGVSYKYQSICTTKKVGYNLLGSDFKTLEFLVMNNSLFIY